MVCACHLRGRLGFQSKLLQSSLSLCCCLTCLVSRGASGFGVMHCWHHLLPPKTRKHFVQYLLDNCMSADRFCVHLSTQQHHRWRQRCLHGMHIWGFPKIKGTILGIPIIRTIVFRGLYWGPPILGNYHIISLRPLMS